MPYFIQLKSLERVFLFKTIKNKMNNLSWDKIYPLWGISRSMFFNYLSGKYPIPENLFYELEKITGIRIEDTTRIEQVKYIEKEIKEPILDNNLSEILGILNGDGHLGPTNSEISVVGNHLEKDYYNYLKVLFEEKFGIRFNIELRDNYFKLRTYSKKLMKLLHQDYKLPLGNKMGQLRIPLQVKNNQEFLKAYLRGLFDTDGCFHIRRKKDPMIVITSADKRFLSEVKNSLVTLGFHVSKGDKRIFLYRLKEVIKFFEEIKPANSKHLKKFELYQNSALLV